MLLLVSAVVAATTPPAPAVDLGGLNVSIQVEQVVFGERSPSRWKSLLTGRRERFEFSRPYGVAWRDEDLLVADPGVGRIVRVDRRGRIQLSPMGLLESPIGVESCEPGVVVADSRTGRVVLLDDDLRLSRILAEGLARPTHVACDDELIFVVETGAHRILKLAFDGKVVGRLGKRGAGHGEFNFPVAAALDGKHLWVGDTLNFRLQRLDVRDGRYLGGFGRLGDAPGETPRIKGAAVDGEGRIWISDAHLDSVSLFSSDGEFLVEIGHRGSAAGEFSFPAGVAIRPGGDVAIADSLNRRVQVLRLSVSPEAKDE